MQTEPSRPVGGSAAFGSFALGAALSVLPMAMPATPWALAPMLGALAAYFLGAAFALGHIPEDSLARALWRRVPASLLWIAALAGVLAAGAAWPTMVLLQQSSLPAVLALSAVIAIVWLGIWRRWPAAVLPFVDGTRGRSGFALARRCGRDAAQLVVEDPSASRGLLAALTLLLLVLGALALGLGGERLAALRYVLYPAWGVAVAPFLAFVLLALVEPARLAAVKAPVLLHPLAPTREAALDLIAPVAGADPTARLYAALRQSRIDDALHEIEAGADLHALPDPHQRDQRTSTMLATLLADARVLRALIARGVDVNLRHGGLTPLLTATRDSLRGRPEAVMTLLANGADPRVGDAEGRTPLHFAALAAEPDIAALLLDAGAPIDALNRDGYSPLGVACGAGNWRMARFLLERRAATEPANGQPALLAAASGEDDSVGVHLLLKHRAKVDARGRLGRTALMGACLAGNAEIAATLLHAGAAVDAADEHGVTPLHEAARAGANAVLERLAKRHPDPARVDQNGRTALVVACQSSRADVGTIERLLQLGVDPAVCAGDGRRALDYALAAGRWPLVQAIDPQHPLPASHCDATPDANAPATETDDARPWEAQLAEALDTDPLRAQHLLRCAASTPGARETLYARLAPKLGDEARRLFASRVDPACRIADGDTLAQSLLRVGDVDAARPLLQRDAAAFAGGGVLAGLLSACASIAAPPAAAEEFALELLDAGGDPFGGAPSRTPLLLAVRLGWPRLAAALLARGADPEQRDVHGHTALQLACTLRRDALLPILLRYGAQPSHPAPGGQTALGIALAQGAPERTAWLDWRGWALPRRPLRDADVVAAAAEGDAAAVERLLALGLPLEATDAQGATALLRACGGGHLPLVRLLLQRGADPTRAAASGATCLSAAISMRQRAVVEMLLVHGVPIDQRLPGGITPLMVAAALGLPDLCGLLLNAGADACARDEQGNNALHALAQFGFAARDRARAVGCWQALLNAGADPTVPGANGLTPLLLLLGARAEPGAACDEDVVAAQLELLLARSLDLDARDARGFTALHLAALHGQLRAVRRLLVAGAPRDARDQINRRPQELALMRGFVDIAGELDGRSDTPTPSMARFLRERS